MRKLSAAVVFIVVLLIISFLPVIPVESGAVVPPPFNRTELGFASLQDMFGVFGLTRVGVTYRPQWYSFAAVMGLLCVGCLIAAYLSKRLHSSGRKRVKA